MQLPQLFLIYRRRCIHHQVLSALRFRERNDVADRFGFAHHGDDTVEAEGNTRMRRCAVLQRVEQETEFGALIFFRAAECGKCYERDSNV